VELQIYKKDQSYILIPNVITRTKEITRAVFKLVYADKQQIKLNVLTDLQDQSSKSRSAKRFTISEEEFFEILRSNVDEDDVDFAQKIIDDALTEDWRIEWKQGSFAVKYFDPVSRKNMTLFIIEKDGSVTTHHGGLDSDDLVDLKKNLAKRVADLFNIKQHRKWEHHWERKLNLKMLRKEYKSFINFVKDFVHEIEKLQNI